MLSYARFLEYMYIVSYMKTKLVMVLSLVVLKWTCFDNP